MKAFYFLCAFITINILFYYVIYYLFNKYINIYEKINNYITHHFNKPKIKTMGGIMFWPSLSFLVTININTILLKIFIYLFSLYGAFDDYYKMNNKTLSWNTAIIVVLTFGLIISLYNALYLNQGYLILFIMIKSNFLYILLAPIYYLCMTTSINITDGINGGLGFPSLIIIASLIIRFIIMKQFIVLYSLISLFISLSVFLYYNMNNKLFMGNVGSYFLAGYFTSMAMIYKIEIAMIFMSLMFVIESFSVVLQLLSVKIRKKKIFKFTPIHHHFELIGYSNKKILLIMSCITVIGCALSFLF